MAIDSSVFADLDPLPATRFLQPITVRLLVATGNRDRLPTSRTGPKSPDTSRRHSLQVTVRAGEREGMVEKTCIRPSKRYGETAMTWYLEPSRLAMRLSESPGSFRCNWPFLAKLDRGLFVGQLVRQIAILG